MILVSLHDLNPFPSLSGPATTRTVLLVGMPESVTRTGVDHALAYQSQLGINTCF